MRNLTLWFLICGVLALSSFGQTDGRQVVVQGDPPLTRATIDKSVDFFQWALGGTFTHDEHAAYERYLIELWESGDVQSIKTIGEVASTRDKLAGQPPEKLRQLHQQLQSGLLSELRAQPTDPLSTILLRAYERLQGTTARNGDTRAGSGNSEGVDAASLIGEWEETHVGSPAYDTGTGGSYTGREVMKNIIRFSPDGSYRSAYVTQSEGFGCEVNVYFGGAGTFRLADGAVHLSEKERRKIVRNSCGLGENEDRRLAPGTYVYPVQLGRDEQGRTMILAVDGKRHTFRKVDGKGLLDSQ